MIGTEREFEEVRFILNSKIRSKLLIHLFFGNKTVEELRILLDKPSSTVLHALHELNLISLVDKKGKTYYLTSRGYIFVLIMYKFINNLNFLRNNEEFLEKHSLDSIPQECLKDLTVLNEGYFVESDESDSSRPLDNYLNLISSANDLNIILPIFSMVHLDEVIKSISKKKFKNLNLITSKSIFDSIQKSGYVRRLNKLSKNINISLWRYDGELDLFLTFSKDFLTLGLFFNDGHFDSSVMFVDESKNSLKWGELIFEYYIEKSTKII